jgi:ribosomal protein S10
MNWAEWRRNEDEPRRRIRIDLQATQRALNDVMRVATEMADTDWLDIERPSSMPDEEYATVTFRELLTDSLARVHARLDEIDAALRGGES